MQKPLLAENRLFVLARKAQRLPHILLAIMMVVIFVLLPPLLGLPIFLLLPPDSHNVLLDALRLVLLLIAQFAPSALALWLWLRFYERRPFWTLGLERTGALAHYGRGFLVGVALFALSVGLSAALGYITPEMGDPRQQGLTALGGVVLVYLGWTIQGPIEELLTRGWLMPVVGARYRPWIGIIVSAMIFALLHSLNPNLSLLAVLNLCLFGLFAALYALWEGGLWGICALHAAWNWAQGNLFGLEVSGQAVEGGILFNLQERGPDVITGGPFGPEAGLSVTAVLAVGVGILAILLRKKYAS